MEYKYQRITKEEEKGLREKYEAALKIAEMLKYHFENPEELLFNPFTFVNYFEFNERVVQDDEKKVCLMTSGYHDESPEYKFRVEFSYALFLFIEEEIVLVDMSDWGGWIDIFQIFVPSSLAEKEEEIKKIIEDMYTVMFYGKWNGDTSYKMAWHYEGYRGYVCYDKEI